MIKGGVWRNTEVSPVFPPSAALRPLRQPLRTREEVGEARRMPCRVCRAVVGFGQRGADPLGLYLVLDPPLSEHLKDRDRHFTIWLPARHLLGPRWIFVELRTRLASWRNSEYGGGDRTSARVGFMGYPGTVPLLDNSKIKKCCGHNFVSSLTSMQRESSLNARFELPIYARIPLVICYQGITCLSSWKIPRPVSSCHSSSAWIEARWDKLTTAISLLPEM